MYVQGTLLNAKEVSTVSFVRHVAGHAPGCHYFIVEPPPGIIMSAAVNWRVVLPDAGQTALLAGGLWSGYEKFVAPLRQSQPNASVAVQCKNVKGQFDRFSIGSELSDSKAVSQRLEDICRLLSRKMPAADIRQMLDETEKSGFWEKLS